MAEDRILAAFAEARREQRLEMQEFRTQVMDRFDRIENRFTELGDDVTVAMASATAALRQHKEMRTDVLELIETMTVIHRQVRRLRTDVDELKAA